MCTRFLNGCSVILIGRLLAPATWIIFASPAVLAQQPPSDVTGAWVGKTGDKIAIVQHGYEVRLCTARSTTGQSTKIYSGSFEASGEAVLTSVPQAVDDMGGDLPVEVREQLIRDFHYSFHINLRKLPNDHVQVSWYVDSVTYSRATSKVSQVTAATTPDIEDFSRVSYSTAGPVRRGIEGDIIHFGRALRNDSRWREWYKRTAGSRGIGDLGPNIRRLAKFRTREKLSSLGRGLSQLADRSRIGQLASKTRGQLVGSASRTSRSWNSAAGISKVGGTALLVVGLAISAYNIITAPEGERLRVASGEAGCWTGALAGGALGAKAGAALGTLLLPGLGTVGGAILGGLVGGFAGGALGSYLAERFHDLIFGRGTSVTALWNRCVAYIRPPLASRVTVSFRKGMFFENCPDIASLSTKIVAMRLEPPSGRGIKVGPQGISAHLPTKRMHDYAYYLAFETGTRSANDNIEDCTGRIP